MSSTVTTTVSLPVATSQWNAERDQLLAELKRGVEGAHRNGDGTWAIPTRWLDDNYQRETVVDLRDMGSELATVLDHLLTAQERISTAELRAAVAEKESEYLRRDVDRLEDELERAEADIEHWIAEHDRREADVIAARRDHVKAQARAQELRSQLTDTEGRLDDTYRELLRLQNDYESLAKKSLLRRLRSRRAS